MSSDAVTYAGDGPLARPRGWAQQPQKNPGSGALVQVQLWFRDPGNSSNQKTSLSDALQFPVAP